jgi:glucokinase
VGSDLGLVADVGRVSVRFGLSEAGGEPRDVERFQTSEHPTFTGALLRYLRGHGLEGQPMRSALAVAGAVHGDVINLTGSRWFLSLAGVEAVLRRPARAINECAAIALALGGLAAHDFLPLPGPVPQPPRGDGRYLVLAIGTGMGVAALVPGGGRSVVVQGEAGHGWFVPATPEEERVQAFLRARKLPASKEMMTCAAGLVTAYEALGGMAGRRPEDVTAAGARDPAAAAAMEMAMGALGGIVGELAMTFGAWDGVYLTGPIARALQPRLAASAFRRRMEGTTPFRRHLASMPVAVVVRRDLELVGAAAAIVERVGVSPETIGGG